VYLRKDNKSKRKQMIIEINPVIEDGNTEHGSVAAEFLDRKP
jgi:hypothetical protein